MIYAKELQKYTRADLIDEFGFDTKIVRELIDRKVIRKNDNDMFVFRYVGIIIINNKVIFILPKYINKANKVNVVKQILLLFREYSRREKLEKDELETIGSIEALTAYNMLSTIIFLLTDYFENGLYSNEKNIFMLNGEDEINWIKTIDEITPIVNEEGPVYLEYYTNSMEDDNENYFRQLHKYTIDLCSKKLISLGLIEFLGVDAIEFDVESMQCATCESMISKIYNELNVQYVSRKQLVLKAMASFLSNEKMNTDNDSISFYGTRSFHTVWEKTCGYVLDNQYEHLKRYINPPKWRTFSGKVYSADTLIPDIISIMKDTFIISDAKYYDIILNDNQKLSGNPGVEDITKQYLYQLAFTEYIEKWGFKYIKNILLFPSEEKNIHRIGDVTIKFMKKLNLEDIILIKLSAEQIFAMYINSKKINLDKISDI